MSVAAWLLHPTDSCIACRAPDASMQPFLWTQASEAGTGGQGGAECRRTLTQALCNC